MAEKTMTTTLQLSSRAFEHDNRISARYTCDGEDINPPLSISGVPESASTLALLVDDPDAPVGTFTHWILWNMDPMLQGIDENTVPPKANQGENNFGNVGYGGPCPPFGTHRYQFHLYALDTSLNLPTGASRKDFLKAVQNHVIAETMLVGRYSRT